MSNSNSNEKSNKHQLHDALAAHIAKWAGVHGVTLDKHDLDDAIGGSHVKGSLDQAVRGDMVDVTRLREVLAFLGGMADFMASKGADDPLVIDTIDAASELLV